MTRLVTITGLLLWTLVACQTESKVRRLVSEIGTVDQAQKLNEKYPTWDIVVHRLDSAAFFSHRIYARLSVGDLFRVGNNQNDEADLYKLLLPAAKGNKPADTLTYYVLQIHIK